jgi:two-component system, NtrC family, response regulator AtoC
MTENQLLIVDDEKSVLNALRMTLEGDYVVHTAENAADALSLLHRKRPDLILLDIGLPDASGIELLTQIRNVDPEAMIIMITAIEETKMVVKALRLGAYDYLVKPLDAHEVKITLQNAQENRCLKDKIRRIQSPNIKRYRFELIGNSPQVKAMIATAQKAASSVHTPVPILGETGTGKGVLARTIHYSFSELPGPFVTVNCSAIAHDLYESELFGYERGAFTGARSEGRIGRFEEAAGGTLFLDEIGSMSLSAQAKLLGVLDDRIFYRVGGNKPHFLSSRIIAATNTDLQKALEEGRFRRDLFFRLNVVCIHVPPLRERAHDIKLLSEYFMSYYNQKFQKNFTRVSLEARKMLLAYPWPGNVRELKNILERIILLESGNIILPEHLSHLLTEHEKALSAEKDFSAGLLDYEEVTKRLMQEALKRTGGNLLEAARQLNMPAHKMRYRIRKYGLKENR